MNLQTHHEAQKYFMSFDKVKIRQTIKSIYIRTKHLFKQREEYRKLIDKLCTLKRKNMHAPKRNMLRVNSYGLGSLDMHCKNLNESPNNGNTICYDSLSHIPSFFTIVDVCTKAYDFGNL